MGGAPAMLSVVYGGGVSGFVGVGGWRCRGDVGGRGRFYRFGFEGVNFLWGNCELLGV